jgi:hypothetical protein
VNEQPPEYWVRKFSLKGFAAVRGVGQRFVNDPAVAWWYARNMVFYVENGILTPAEVRRLTCPE